MLPDRSADLRTDVGESGKAAHLSALPGWQRVALMAAAVTGAALALPFLPIVVLIAVWLVLGLASAFPNAANAAVGRGHWLKRMNPHPLRGLLQGGPLRVAVWGSMGILAVAVLLVRLAAAGAPAWAGAAAAMLAVLAVVRFERGLMNRIYLSAHAGATLRWKAFWTGMAAMVVVSGLMGWWLGPGDPAAIRPVASALLSEAFEAHRLWVGVEAWIMGGVAALDILSPAVEAILAFLLTAVTGGAAAALAIAALMPTKDLVRAVAASSDAPVPPRARPAALLAASLLATAVAVAALWAEHGLSVVATEARPLAQLQTMAVERIGTAYHPVGTHARIAAGRTELAALEDSAEAELRALVDVGFDAMLAGVDPFLDDYYSLRGEYWRIGVTISGWMRGDAEAAIEAHLASRLSEALDGDRNLRPVADRLATLDTVLAEEQMAQQAREESLIGSPLADINPARLRVEASFPALAPLPELRSSGLLSALETRLAGSGAVGVLGAVVARRVLQVLVQRGILRMGARAVLAAVPLVGTLVMIGTDAAALAMEEHFNRADFRAEIVGAIEEQRASVLNTLAAPAGD